MLPFQTPAVRQNIFPGHLKFTSLLSILKCDVYQPLLVRVPTTVCIREPSIPRYHSLLFRVKNLISVSTKAIRLVIAKSETAPCLLNDRKWIVLGKAMWYESRLSGSCGFVPERRWSRRTQVQCCGHKQLELVFTGKPYLISLEWPQKCPIRKLWHHRPTSFWPLLWISQMVYSLFHRYGLVAGLKSSCMPMGQTYTTAQYSIQQTVDSFIYERLRYVNKLYEIEMISNFTGYINSLVVCTILQQHMFIHQELHLIIANIVPLWVHSSGISGTLHLTWCVLKFSQATMIS